MRLYALLLMRTELEHGTGTLIYLNGLEIVGDFERGGGGRKILIFENNFKGTPQVEYFWK